MKKATVNAQVTAIVSLSEILGFIVILVITLITGNKEISMILFRLLEVILLPYAFLMNTRENKNRIVEHGWLNVLRNIVSVPDILTSFNRRTVEISLSTEENVPRKNVYTISKPSLPEAEEKLEDPSPKSDILYSSRNNSPHEKPSTSINNNLQLDVISPQNLIKSTSSDDDVSYDDPKENVSTKRTRYLDELTRNLNNETTYICTFSRFVHEEHNNYTESQSYMVDNETLLQRIEKLLSSSNRSSRINMRRNMIKELKLNENDQNIYRKMFDDFVDLEEGFLG